MANVQHSSLTGADLHECKGAASAASGQVPVANGSGSAPFGFLPYSVLTGKPLVPVVYNGNTATGATPQVRVFTATAVAGLFTVSITGLSSILGVSASVVSGAGGIGVTAVASINTATNTGVSGTVVVLGASGNTLGTNQTVYVTVIGV